MTFPRETEEQIRRSVLDTGQEHIRRTLEAVRELTNMVSDFSEQNAKEMDTRVAQIKRLKDEAVEQRRVIIQQLAESGMLLLNREDFLHLAVQIGEIADYCEGAAHRISYMAKNRIQVDEDVRQGILSLSKNVLKTVTNLRETILSLNYNRQRALDMAQNVEVAEYAVDELYRELEFKIFESKHDTRTILLLWSLAGLLEDISDKAEDAIDSIRILALGA
jgi:predicted phosphate transport protein (TIGR00153 family)